MSSDWNQLMHLAQVEFFQSEERLEGLPLDAGDRVPGNGEPEKLSKLWEGFIWNVSQHIFGQVKRVKNSQASKSQLADIEDLKIL